MELTEKVLGAILLNRSKYVVMYDGPIPGLNSNGVSTTGNMKSTVSVDDAVKLQRYIQKQLCIQGGIKEKDSSEYELLLEFITNNWAEIEEVK